MTIAVAADILSLVLLTPPGEWGADVVVGSHAALRRADGLRRPARGLLRLPRSAQALHAGTHHRRVGGCRRQPGAAHGIADARAAYPPREGDIEHLHRAGVAGDHGRHVRGVSRRRKACSGIAQQVHLSAVTLASELKKLGYARCRRRVLRHAQAQRTPTTSRSTRWPKRRRSISAIPMTG